MRHYIKSFVIATGSVYFALKLVPTVNFGPDPKNLLFLIGGIFLISQIIDPIFSLILLPINHLTFGLVMFALNIALFYGLLKLLPGFSISAYNFPGADIYGVILPGVKLNQVLTIVTVALAITVIQKILHAIFE